MGDNIIITKENDALIPPIPNTNFAKIQKDVQVDLLQPALQMQKRGVVPPTIQPVPQPSDNNKPSSESDNTPSTDSNDSRTSSES